MRADGKQVTSRREGLHSTNGSRLHDLSEDSRPGRAGGVHSHDLYRPGPPLSFAQRLAFTMIELLVVIGIIGILIAIAVPTASRIMANQKKSNTKANLEVISNAIEAYRACKKGALPPDWFSIKDLDPGPKEWFEDLNDDGRWQSSEPLHDDDGDALFCGHNLRQDIPGISGKIAFRPVWRLKGGAWQPDIYTSADFRTSEDFAGNMKHIETMYLYMTQLCPEAAQILSHLPAKVVTNKDQCSWGTCADVVTFDTNGNGVNDQSFNTAGKDKTVDLFEIRDAWDRPLQYNRFDLGKGKVGQASWEIRSAGDDEKFSAPFSPESDSDDVVLRGQ